MTSSKDQLQQLLAYCETAAVEMKYETGEAAYGDVAERLQKILERPEVQVARALDYFRTFLETGMAGYAAGAPDWPAATYANILAQLNRTEDMYRMLGSDVRPKCGRRFVKPDSENGRPTSTTCWLDPHHQGGQHTDGFTSWPDHQVLDSTYVRIYSYAHRWEVPDGHQDGDCSACKLLAWASITPVVEQTNEAITARLNA